MTTPCTSDSNLWLRLFGVLSLFVALPWIALADGDGDEGDMSRPRGMKAHEDAEQRDRLLANARFLLSRTPERQMQLRKLNRELREMPTKEAQRLQKVLDRYNAWMRALPESEQQAILASKADSETIERIRALRDAQWLERQPSRVRESLAALDAKAKTARMHELRKEDRKRRDEWKVATRNWDQLMQERLPTFPQLWPQVEVYVRETLRPMLSPDETEQLDRALKNKGPGLAKVILTLSDRHPVRLPGPSKGPSRFEELPEEYRSAFPQLKDPQTPEMRKVSGRWPEYAEAVTNYTRKQRPKHGLRQLGPCRPVEFSPAVQSFLETDLRPRLDKNDQDLLRDMAGKWPNYPRTMLNISRKYGLQIPGMALPGPKEFWDSMRLRPAFTAE